MHFHKNRARVALLLALLLFGLSPAPALGRFRSAGALQGSSQTSNESLGRILSYISRAWETLTRSLEKCETVADTKSPEKSVLYLPAGFPVPAAVAELQKNCAVMVEQLPAAIQKPAGIDVSRLPRHGLLYLEHPYVVPGGFFNEMYGWDSYFILRGLLREGKVELARGMVENFFFEIEHYGMILNANRTYFLTRSQPPFLTSMILAVYEAEKARGREDRKWLEKAYGYAVRDYELWIREPHLAGETGLSRYYDFGEGPVPELGEGTGAYARRVIRYFLTQGDPGNAYLAKAGEKPVATRSVGPLFSLYLCDQGAEGPPGKTCELIENVGLTADFYKGDRSMRESGFDVSFRFEPFSAGTHHYAPVCLNSLLYKVESDLEQMSALLGRRKDAARWRESARNRKGRIQKYFWDDARGLFFDYNFQKGARSTYEFATAFYPLWVGAASASQARAVVRNLPSFEQAGGLAMSRQETKAQWDYPYGWAPVQLIAVEGLRRYGFQEEANRISKKFLSTIVENFARDGTIREKYNVVTRSSETQVEVGYAENVIGFGWTNGVFLELLRALPKAEVAQLAESRAGN